MRPIDRVLAALEHVRPNGRGQWKARCPAHDDRNPSLSVKEGDDGGVLLHCFAACDAGDVVAAMGLKFGDLVPDDRRYENKGRGRDQFKRHAAPEKPPAAIDGSVDTPRRRVLNMVRIDQIERKPTDWLIRGYLVRNTLAGLIAPPGTCKSFLAVDWACRVATGTPWHGKPVKRGAVFYLAGEGHAGISKRVEGWCIANEASRAGMPLFVSGGIPFLCDSQNVEDGVAELEEIADALFFGHGIEPALIVIDTVARAMNGADENTAEDMGRFIAAKDALRARWGATVLSVHHTGHEGTRARGSSNYAANLDSDFYLTNKGDQVQLKAGDKSKDWRPPAPVMLSRVEITTSVIGEDGQPETTLVLHDAAGAILERSSAQRDKVLELHRRGLSERTIADEIGVAKTTVHRWIKNAA